MTPGLPDPRVVDRHLIALRRTLAFLRRHSEVSVDVLDADVDRRLAIERGLQLCAQNALDIAGHIGSALGLDPDTYGAAIACLVEGDIGSVTAGSDWRSPPSTCPEASSLCTLE